MSEEALIKAVELSLLKQDMWPPPKKRIKSFIAINNICKASSLNVGILTKLYAVECWKSLEKMPF